MSQNSQKCLLYKIILIKWCSFLILNDSTCQFYYKINICFKPYRKNGRRWHKSTFWHLLNFFRKLPELKKQPIKPKWQSDLNNRQFSVTLISGTFVIQIPSVIYFYFAISKSLKKPNQFLIDGLRFIYQFRLDVHNWLFFRALFRSGTLFTWIAWKLTI